MSHKTDSEHNCFVVDGDRIHVIFVVEKFPSTNERFEKFQQDRSTHETFCLLLTESFFPVVIYFGVVTLCAYTFLPLFTMFTTENWLVCWLVFTSRLNKNAHKLRSFSHVYFFIA